MTVSVPGGVVEVLSGDGLNLAAAANRQAAAMAKLQSEIDRVEGKLANERFVSKAPAEVVGGEREKLRRLREELRKLREELDSL